MPKGFMMKFSKMQPSQLYISSAKLASVGKVLDSASGNSIEPIPVKRLGREVVILDGHTRAFAAFLRNLTEIPVYWDDDEELDWDEYKVCVKWCKEEGIRTIEDLKDRVVSQKDYEKLWYARCDRMHRSLAKRRRALSLKASRLFSP